MLVRAQRPLNLWMAYRAACESVLPARKRLFATAASETRADTLQLSAASAAPRLELHSPPFALESQAEEDVMAESVYKIIEIVGTSPTSWEKAAAAAVERAATTLRDLRVAEVTEQDVVITDGRVESYRVRLKVSFKYED